MGRAVSTGLEAGQVLAEVRDMGPVTVREIATGAGLPEWRVRAALGELKEAGLVESEGYQRRAHVWMAS